MYVLFDQRRKGRRRLLHLATTPDFNHCAAMVGYDDSTLYLDPAIDGLHILLYDQHIDVSVAQAIDSGVTAILYYPHDSAKAGQNYIPRGIYTCVSAVKAILGIKGLKSFFTITPRQLYRLLLCSGAQPVYERKA